MSSSALAEPPGSMNVDQFLAWSETVPGRHELVDGEAFAMAPERVGHARLKYRVQRALEAGIQRAALRCEMLPDGITVRVNESTAYEPDALVHCGDPLDPRSIEAPAPVIVVEVISPGTRSIDTGKKAFGYLRLPSLHHYLIVEPERAVVIHHRRTGETTFETRFLREGSLVLDPPGLECDIGEIFATT